MNKKPSKPKPLELTVKLKRRAWMTIRDDGYNIYICVAQHAFSQPRRASFK